MPALHVSCTLRIASQNDIPVVHSLIETSARGIAFTDYTPEQIEAALLSAWGVDTQLIRDQTYFIALVDGTAAGCGGWSRRATLFGGDLHAQRESRLLDPSHEAARIRAFFVHPDYTRKGIGRLLLQRCETEAVAAGFRSAELVATLPGERLYKAFGYTGSGRKEYLLEGGVRIDFIPMRKDFLNSTE